jgi:hypothetical protein
MKLQKEKPQAKQPEVLLSMQWDANSLIIDDTGAMYVNGQQFNDPYTLHAAVRAWTWRAIEERKQQTKQQGEGGKIV